MNGERRTASVTVHDSLPDNLPSLPVTGTSPLNFSAGAAALCCRARRRGRHLRGPAFEPIYSRRSTGTSAPVPDAGGGSVIVVVVPVFENWINHSPVEGRKTARSALPSPS